jgi:hypothetical protein
MPCRSTTYCTVQFSPDMPWADKVHEGKEAVADIHDATQDAVVLGTSSEGGQWACAGWSGEENGSRTWSLIGVCIGTQNGYPGLFVYVRIAVGQSHAGDYFQAFLPAYHGLLGQREQCNT